MASYLFEKVNLTKVKLNLDIKPRDKVPENIAKPLCILAEKINAKPWMDYYRCCVMNNFKRIDPTKEISLLNLALIRPITGFKAEAGFFLTHVAINGKSKQLIETVEGILDAVVIRDKVRACRYFETLLNLVGEQKSLLKEMYH